MSDEWRGFGAGCGKSRFLPIRLGTRAHVRGLFASLGMTIHGGFGGLGVGWGWLDMRSGRQRAGLKTGYYMLNEFGARGGHWRVRGWGRVWGFSLVVGRAGFEVGRDPQVGGGRPEGRRYDGGRAGRGSRGCS